jgi:hypothetical protein
MSNKPKLPEATEPELTQWHREFMLEKLGMIHESDLAALSSTISVSRRRWDLEGVLLGCEKYFRIADIKRLLDDKLDGKTKPAKADDVVSVL